MPGDFYCSKETDGDNMGYVVPQEAVSVLDQHRCIGIVFYAEQHDSDDADYTGTGIGQMKCHGYVVALTDVHNNSGDRLRWEWGPKQEYNQRVNAFTNTGDWQGYSNSLKFHEFVNDGTNKTNGWEMKHFPAALACETYGSRTIVQNGNSIDDERYDWQKPLAAPDNTSGWFLPSCGQLSYLYQNRDFLTECINTVKNKTSEQTLKDHICWFSTSWCYWSSTESSRYSRNAWGVGFNCGGTDSYSKYGTYDVRAVLAF